MDLQASAVLSVSVLGVRTKLSFPSMVARGSPPTSDRSSRIPRGTSSSRLGCRLELRVVLEERSLRSSAGCV
eukprot:573385-Pyramimonas_sp.AAC.1